MPDYGLGATLAFDERSREYPIKPLLSAAPLTNRYWDNKIRLNQGQTPRCVGYGSATEAAMEPVAVKGVTNALGDQFYALAQQLDEIPGVNYDGSTLLGGMKAMQQQGYIGEYRWAFGIDDLLATISQIGPVCLATVWYNSMFSPNPQGQIVINGATAGGHFYVADEVDADRGRVWICNTWGEPWGVRGQASRGGRAWMAAEDVSKLLKQGGSASVITQRFDPTSPPVPPPPPPIVENKIDGIGVWSPEKGNHPIWVASENDETIRGIGVHFINGTSEERWPLP